MSENKPCVVQAAAKVAFASSAVKQRAANQLILASKSGKYTLDTVQLALETVAQAAWLQPKDLLKQLKADPCFKVVQTAGAGSPSGYFVGLNILKIMSVAMNTTSTGMLTEELPPPKGFVDGKHPIRPGRCARNCCMMLFAAPADQLYNIAGLPCVWSLLMPPCHDIRACLCCPCSCRQQWACAQPWQHVAVQLAYNVPVVHVSWACFKGPTF
jgi:hypothetical protein